MNAIAIIPARMSATRFPGKPLRKISGIPMVGHCYFRSCMAHGLSAVYVATCDDEIVEYVESIGGGVIRTKPTHNRATDRTAEAMCKIEVVDGHEVEVVIMVQGDEPLILPSDISSMLEEFRDPSVEIVNIASKIKTIGQFRDPNNVKVVVNKNMDAIYFSREPIPSPWRGVEGIPMYMQVGVIAFRRNALFHFNQLSESPLEQIESVDMNRVIEAGGRIRVVITDATTIGVDTPQEADAVESLIEYDAAFQKYRHRA